MTLKQLPAPLKRWRATAALAAFAFAFAFGATAASRDIIVCGGGVYCDAEVRQPCLDSGRSAAFCDRLWRGCVLDACPQ
ncbi:hypothetical protein SAMN04487939_101459 [Lysobacter sp. yr284]|uniref:hypothetical protein n=1 Tax=Lysobacter sp. yr284 TaxID=1761791 RepID=UPI00089A76C7|nr:hypothetical protein [Lysobacter sp. yr284]SDY24862.1 hypothetical protein SAMN04487939_101459 [Lysobacter sp. yr284]